MCFEALMNFEYRYKSPMTEAIRWIFSFGCDVDNNITFFQMRSEVPEAADCSY